MLNGVKWHVTSFNAADYAFFQGKLTDGEHVGEHAMFLVDLPSPGVRVVRTPAYMHTLGHAHQHPIVAFEDVRVPAAQLVGAEGDGMSFAYEWFRFERLMVAARCLGAAERLVAEMTSFASERIVSGRPIAEFGAVQAMLADSLTELFAARSLTYETARGIDAGADVKVQHAQCSMAKLYAAEMAGRVADRAVQVFGGRGYMREYAAERFYRELRVERIWEGTSEVQRSIIADQMIKRGPGSPGLSRLSSQAGLDRADDLRRLRLGQRPEPGDAPCRPARPGTSRSSTGCRRPCPRRRRSRSAPCTAGAGRAR